MSNPSFVTSENVKFKGVLENAVVLRDDSGVKNLILWDTLSAGDRDMLTTLINAYGGTTPLASDTAGSLTAHFSPAAVGGNATGLSSTASTTAGVATIDVGSAKTGSSSSGLSTAAGTHGTQTVNLQPSVVGSTATGLVDTVPATAGYQVVNVGGAKVGGGATGLANDATAYTATITVDGVAKAISVVGSAAQTFTTLLSEINTDLGAAAVATLVGGNIKVTSATTGTSSTVSIVDTDLFATLTGYVAVLPATAGVNAVVTTYTATITVDGVAKAISVAGGAAQTFTTLVSEINTDLGAAATATLAGGDIKITASSVGLSSTVVITPGTLFPALAGFVGVFPPANGGGAARSYSATVVIDGTILKTVNFTGLAGDTFAHVVSELNTDLGASATASISGGNLIITSATTGVSSSVKVYDSGFLFSSLSGYVKISDVTGVAPRTYTATITVDGVAKAISVVGAAAQTFTTLLSEINTDLGASATAAITGGNIVVTSATTGLASKVTGTDGNLFKSVTGFAGFATPQAGAEDMYTVFQTSRTPAGTTFGDHFHVVTVGAKPAVPPYCPHTTAFIYFDGSAWLYLDDDTPV